MENGAAGDCRRPRWRFCRMGENSLGCERIPGNGLAQLMGELGMLWTRAKIPDKAKGLEREMAPGPDLSALSKRGVAPRPQKGGSDRAKGLVEG